MRYLALFLILSSFCLMEAAEECTETSWGGFSKKGFSKCTHNNQYIKTFQRTALSKRWWFKKKDPISRLTAANCCKNKATAYKNDNAICQSGDWWKEFDRAGWALCPTGYFLQGLYRTSGQGLSNIEYGRCCRPWAHPRSYSKCYEESINHNDNTIGCKKVDYYIVGMKRSSENRLKGLEKFKCCKFNKRRSPPTSLEDVKQYIMEKTRLDLVWLADYLGYAWCRGCGSLFIGDDFKRVGDSWEAGTRGELCGNSRDKRLKINYKNVKFVTFGKVTWGKKVRQVFLPEEVDSGVLFNDDPSPAKLVIDKEEKSTRSVTHVVSNQWKKSHQIGVDLAGFLVGFTCGAIGGVGGRISYKFKYEDTTTTTNSEQKTNTKIFRIRSEKTVPGRTKARWRILMTKTRTTIPYTAKVLAQFPVEFDGILRSHSNFHYKYRDNNKKPYIKYQFGDDKKPFYRDLKEVESRNMAPWQWDKMEQKNSQVKKIIARLIDKNTYLFTVSGQIEDVHGTRVEVQWKNGDKKWPEPYKRGVASSPPRVHPPAPEVDIFSKEEPITEDVEE